MPEPAPRRVYAGRVVTLDVDAVTLPNGARIELEVVRHPGASAVVPLDDDGHVFLIEQYRHAAGGWILEVPAGKLDGGESPEACARRELVEEAGVSATAWHALGSILTTPGFSDEIIHLFLARQLEPAQQALEADEVLHVRRVPFEAAVAMCRRGEIRDAKSMCALFLARDHLRGERA